MDQAARVIDSPTDDRRLIDAIARERERLRNFIRKHVPDVDDAEDILQDVLDELPDEQRDVFLAHEVEGRSFKEMAATTGLSVNTLLARKHYAVLRLRRRLEAIYNEFRTR